MCNVAVILRVTFIFKNLLRSRMRKNVVKLFLISFLKVAPLTTFFSAREKKAVEVSRI